MQSYLTLFSSAFFSCSVAIFDDSPPSDGDDERTYSSTSSLPSLSSSSSMHSLMRADGREWSLGIERTSSHSHLSLPGASLLSTATPLCPFHIPEDVQLRPLTNQSALLPSQTSSILSTETSTKSCFVEEPPSSDPAVKDSTQDLPAPASAIPLLHIPDAFLRDVRRSVSLLVESTPRVTEWGLATIMEQLISFVSRTGKPCFTAT